MNQNRRERPAINEIASDANSLRFAWLTSTLNSWSRRMKRMSSARRGAFLHGAGDRLESLALLRRCAYGGRARHQPLQLAAHLEHPELLLDVEFRDEDAPPGEHRDQPLAREALKSLAHRRAPDAQRFRERPLGEHLARLEPQGADHLLERDVRPIREAAVGVLARLRDSGPFSVVQVRLQ